MDAAAVEEIERNPALLGEWLRAQEVEPLLEVVLEPRVRRGWRLCLIPELPRFGDSRVVPALVQALADDDFAIRGRAATALARCSDNGMPVQEANEALLVCAEDRDEYARMKALYALSVIGEQKAVPALLDIAERSPVKNYRHSAAAALGRLGVPEAETFFIRYLDDPEDAPFAATWLAEIGTDASADSLRAAAERDPANSSDYSEALEAIERRNSDAAT